MKIHKTQPLPETDRRGGTGQGRWGFSAERLLKSAERCREERRDLVLETFTRVNVPIYEPFGFVLVETRESTKLPLADIV